MLSETILKNKSDLTELFRRSAVPQNDLKIGIEVERSGVFEESLSPVSYGGAQGYNAILKKLITEAGWQAIEKEKNGDIFALRRGESEIHTEMDGRLELASKPRKQLKNLRREFEMYTSEINAISREFGVRWVSMGLQPFSALSDFQWTKKSRSRELHEFFRENKVHPGKWIFKANSVHVNFGYTSERDAIQKFQTLFSVAPIIAAIFANSPLENGKFSGYMGARLQNTQAFFWERNRVREEFFGEDFSFEKWVDIVCDLPMIYIERKDQQIPMQGTTFSEFLKKGHGRHHPRLKDFILHLKSCWTEIKMKNWLEFRSIDCVPPHLLLSIPALIRGITRNAEVMRAARSLMKEYSFAEYNEIRETANKHALAGNLPGKGKILDLAKELLEIASTSLKDYGIEKRSNVDDSRLLWPIKEYVFVREQSPAEFVMEQWNGEWRKNPYKLLEWSES